MKKVGRTVSFVVCRGFPWFLERKRKCVILWYTQLIEVKMCANAIVKWREFKCTTFIMNHTGEQKKFYEKMSSGLEVESDVDHGGSLVIGYWKYFDDIESERYSEENYENW